MPCFGQFAGAFRDLEFERAIEFAFFFNEPKIGADFIDELIVFKSLGKAELVQIVDIMLSDVERRLKEMQIAIEVTTLAKEAIIKEGSDFTYGARPLKRAIQKLVEDEIAELLLKGEIVKGDRIVVENQAGKLHFSVRSEV